MIRYAKEVNADAIPVSQVVTQRNAHVENMTAFIDLADEEGIRGKTVLVAGGPRIDGDLAMSLGFDAGFGKGT